MFIYKVVLRDSIGCKKPRVNCFPFTWKTIPEYWQEAGVKWQLYQDPDNFEDNSLAYFVQYQKASKDSELRKRGNSYLGLKRFYEDAAEGKLPEISIIVGPAELAEHMPYLPSDGAWLQKQVVDAVTHSPRYNETALFISYDGEMQISQRIRYTLNHRRRGRRIWGSCCSFPSAQRHTGRMDR